VAQGIIANFGTWSLDETSKKASLHIEGALIPNVIGTTLEATVAGVSSDELKTTGGTVLGNATWRRAK
jgi:hypothetical protein